METAGYRGTSRRQRPKGKRKKEKKVSHFRTVCLGGFDETETICYVWEVLKSIEAVNREEKPENKGGPLKELEQQIRKRVRVEMRRYFLRRKRRDMKMIMGAMLSAAFAICLFGCLIGIDRVEGNSMYPYLNNGDWIVYTRLWREIRRDEVVVFEKNGENLVKRVAGLPGDTVEISPSGSHVVINGEVVRENYMTLTGRAEDDGRKEDEEPGNRGVLLTVLDGQYMVLGDNRSISIDSRDSGMGTVPEGDILGRVWLIFRVS